VVDGKGGEWRLTSEEILVTTPTLCNEVISVLGK